MNFNTAWFWLAILLIAANSFAQRVRTTSSDYIAKSKIIMALDSRIPIDIKFNVDKQPTKNLFFAEYRKSFGLTKDNDFKTIRQTRDKLGEIHYRYNQYYKGIEILGAQYILHEKNGFIRAANGRLVHKLNLDVNPIISEETALNAALREVNAITYMWEDNTNELFLKKEQNDANATFYPKGSLKITSGSKELIGENCKLVYRFDIYAEKPFGRYFVDIDAKTGEVVNKINRIHETDVSGSGASLYNSTVPITVDEVTPSLNYRLQEHTTRSAGIETYDLNNGTDYGLATDISSSSANGPWDQTGVSAHWGAEMTFDYYFTKEGRNSFDDAGGTILSYVHYSTNYVNAFWDGTRMTYGDGNGTTYGPLVSLDVTGHEITHGVTEYSSNLMYQGESGALNESFSDIFGNLIEFYKEGIPGTGTGNWRIGEDITTSGLGIRNMANPNEFGDPDTYGGTFWYDVLGCVPSSSNDACGVHINSGVQNFWFYLICEGGSGINDNGDSYNVTAIGLDDAASIAYRNNTVYLVPGSNYYSARIGAIDAAIDLFGANSAEVQAVKDAWDAVGVYEFTPSGNILVWEGILGGQDYSGAFINNYLTNAGFNTKYTNVFPPTLIGYDAVFLSFGNYGRTGSNTIFDGTMAGEVVAYLQAGGRLYLEGGDALGYDQFDYTTLINLFGLVSASDGSRTNTIDGLAGQSGAITSGMLFTASSQLRNNWIDLYNPNTGTIAFIESSYGNVAVQNVGSYGQKTFCFSYALSGLIDGSSPNTKNDLMAAIINFFDIPLSASIKVFLEGSYAGTSTMSTSLNSILPTSDPYSLGETVSSIPSSDIVDWVKVELRTGATPSTATSILKTRAAFLKSDGSVVDMDGTSPVEFPEVSDGDFYLVIKHRNHLGIMSSTAQSFTSGNVTIYDFTTGQIKAYGTNPLANLGDGKFGMYAGDANSDGKVKYNGSANDKNSILAEVGLLTPNNIVSGYSNNDVSMDGLVKYNGAANDKNKILGVVGLLTPNNVVQTQVP